MDILERLRSWLTGAAEFAREQQPLLDRMRALVALMHAANNARVELTFTRPQRDVLLYCRNMLLSACEYTEQNPPADWVSTNNSLSPWTSMAFPQNASMFSELDKPGVQKLPMRLPKVKEAQRKKRPKPKQPSPPEDGEPEPQEEPPV